MAPRALRVLFACIAMLSSLVLMAVITVRAVPFPSHFPVTWSAGPPLSTARVQASVTTLLDNRVLVLGGYPGPIATGEVFDPVSSHWSLTPPMSIARVYHVASLLTDGRVLVAGGAGTLSNPAPDSSAELFDPDTNTWWTIPPMHAPREGASAVTMADGRVLVVGGDPSPASVEIYDPGTNSWSVTGSLNTGRALAGLALLEDGRVLAAGGNGGLFGTSLVSSEVFDPSTGTWSNAAPMHRFRTGAAFTPLADGRLMVFGGAGVSPWTDGEVYDPALNTWTLTPSAGSVGGYLTSISLRRDGRVLAAGGTLFDNGLSTDTALYDPVTNTWSTLAPMHIPRFWAAAVTVPGLRTLMIGGSVSGQAFSPSNDVEVFGYDSLPFANAGPDQTVYGCGTCLGVATLDASGTLDGDDDLLTYTWSEGTRTLATTTDPIKVVTLSFGLGIHTVTLTVTDGAGAVSTDSVVITVRDIVGISSSELAQCRADMAVLEAELAAHVAAIEQNFRQEFGDSQFVIPGGSRRAQLQNVVSAIVAMNRGQKRTLYRSLGGQ